MPDLDTTIADGDPGHALLHQDTNVEVNSVRERLATAEGTLKSQGTALTGKYTKPTGGIPQSDLTAAAQALLTAAGLANVRAIEWTGNLATVRPTADAKIVYVWIKRDPAHSDPPTDDTHMLAGRDLLLRATSG